MTTLGMDRIGVLDTRRESASVLPAVLRRTAWGAIFVGGVTAIGLQLLLTVLGVAIGITAVDRTDSATGIGMAAGVWWLITGVLSLFAGGAVLGRTAGIQRSIDVLLHAFAMWAVTAICGFLLVWATASVATTAGSQVAASIAWNPAHVGQYGRSSSTAGAGALLGSQATAADPAVGRAGDREVARNDALATDRTDRVDQPTTAELEASREAAQAGSWWTLAGLMLGAAASLGGAWLATADRLFIRPPSVAAP